jgi:fluoride exporter
MATLLAVLAGGFAGAIARQEAFSALQKRARTRFPVGILAVNLSGAFVLGLLFGLGVTGTWPRWLALGVQTGFIGAYTTYSTWAVDSLTLDRGGAHGLAVANLTGSLLAGVLLAWAGTSLGSLRLTGGGPERPEHGDDRGGRIACDRGCGRIAAL